MNTVSKILKTKPGDLWTAPPDAPIFNALKIMADKNVGALLVMADDKLVGIFSERDYARNSILKGKSCLAGNVGQLMTPKVFYVSPGDTLEDCMALMTEKHIRHLPVLDDGRVVGMITLGDVVKQIMSNQEFTIRELEKFISGDYRG